MLIFWFLNILLLGAYFDVLLLHFLFHYYLGAYIYKKFSHRNLSEVIRNDGPSSHISKAGTPTMGGLLILSSLLVTTLLWSNLANKYIQYLIITTLLFAIIGFIDDYIKLKSRKGISASFKIVLCRFLQQLLFRILMFSQIEFVQEQQFIIPFF
jgi:phospho-N-acetylmuramoyl-pentapeptide-transferase